MTPTPDPDERVSKPDPFAWDFDRDPAMTTDDERPSGTGLRGAEPTVEWMLERIGSHTYDGGVNGTCYECPFASPPLYSDGHEADWGDVSNDPTEAHFRCSLPGRDNTAVVWGEYAPCEISEWTAAVALRLAAHPDAAAGTTVAEWGVRDARGFVSKPSIVTDRKEVCPFMPDHVVVRRTRTTFADQVTEWEEVR